MAVRESSSFLSATANVSLGDRCTSGFGGRPSAAEDSRICLMVCVSISASDSGPAPPDTLHTEALVSHLLVAASLLDLLPRICAYA